MPNFWLIPFCLFISSITVKDSEGSCTRHEHRIACPRRLPLRCPTCEDRCQTDDECNADGRICCAVGNCGRICIKPRLQITRDPMTRPIRPISCTRSEPMHRPECPTKGIDCPNCQDVCESDQDCFQNQGMICCAQGGCGRKCVHSLWPVLGNGKHTQPMGATPMPPRPGQMPLEPTCTLKEPIFRPECRDNGPFIKCAKCQDRCKDDSECLTKIGTNKMVCCAQGSCGRMCVTSLHHQKRIVPPPGPPPGSCTETEPRIRPQCPSMWNGMVCKKCQDQCNSDVYCNSKIPDTICCAQKGCGRMCVKPNGPVRPAQVPTAKPKVDKSNGKGVTKRNVKPTGSIGNVMGGIGGDLNALMRSALPGNDVAGEDEDLDGGQGEGEAEGDEEGEGEEEGDEEDEDEEDIYMSRQPPPPEEEKRDDGEREDSEGGSGGGGGNPLSVVKGLAGPLAGLGGMGRSGDFPGNDEEDDGIEVEGEGEGEGEGEDEDEEEGEGEGEGEGEEEDEGEEGDIYMSRQPLSPEEEKGEEIKKKGSSEGDNPLDSVKGLAGPLGSLGGMGRSATSMLKPNGAWKCTSKNPLYRPECPTNRIMCIACNDQCVSDLDCHSGKICCTQSGCGLHCVDPLFPKVPTLPTHKPTKATQKPINKWPWPRHHDHRPFRPHRCNFYEHHCWRNQDCGMWGFVCVPTSCGRRCHSKHHQRDEYRFADYRG